MCMTCSTSCCDKIMDPWNVCVRACVRACVRTYVRTYVCTYVLVISYLFKCAHMMGVSVQWNKSMKFRHESHF
jgi:hypothetical protein